MTETAQLPSPTWFVGCGNMGGAMLDGWRAAGVDLTNLVVIRPSGMPIKGVRTVATLAEAGPRPKLVVLAFKPQKLDEVAPQLKPWLTSKTVVVSILAGVEIASLRKRFPGAGSIIRAMPNLPVAIRRGVVALGYAVWMSDEAKVTAVGAVAGAGPAYVGRFIAALAKAGEKRGISEEIASTVALETVLGTAWLAAARAEDMDSIARRVASPKGTTEAGLAVLDRDGVLDQIVALAMDAAAKRGAELAADARVQPSSLAEEARTA
jgi:pyrroline-5-carboxylate reductase